MGKRAKFEVLKYGWFSGPGFLSGCLKMAFRPLRLPYYSLNLSKRKGRLADVEQQQGA
jgi:hypothetical protein